MKKLAALLSFSVTIVLLYPLISVATSGVPIVIEEVQAGTSNYRHEFIALRNRTADVIDLDTYSVAVANSQGVDATDIPLTGDLAPYSVLHLISEPYLATLEADGKLPELDYISFEVVNSNALASGGGHVMLRSADAEIDRLGYGDAASPEGVSAPVLRGGASLKRCTDLQGMSADTNDNSVDFYLHDTPLDGQPGDLCTQAIEPSVPSCSGIVLSEILPNPSGPDAGKEFIEVYNPTESTVQLDGCSLVVNGKTYDLPADTALDAQKHRAFYDSETKLTLPNSAGGSVTLITSDVEETIEYPAGLKDDISWGIFGGEWRETNKPTPHAANKATEPNEVIDGGKGGGGLAPCAEGKYRHPETNRCRNNETASTLTPCREGQERNPATNRCRSTATNAQQLTPCKAGQERNPETNRCRSTSSSASQLVPCKPGQERNPDTNRCRSTTAASSDLKPCNPDQFRNPETNRCKKIDSDSSTLKPCKEGQERNPDTNRCRKIRETAEAAFAVDETPPQGGAHYGWWAAGVAATGAVGYGAYEWRRDIARGFMRLRSFGKKDPPDAGSALP